MALSTMKHMLMQSALRRGDGLFKVPASRQHDRLFGQGRTKLHTYKVKLENLGADYDVRKDSSIKAFVRMIAARACANAENPEV